MKGLYNKYHVTKTDGSPIDPEARYFVLRYDTDSAARKALAVYARYIEAENPDLARDLRSKLAERGLACMYCGFPLFHNEPATPEPGEHQAMIKLLHDKVASLQHELKVLLGTHELSALAFVKSIESFFRKIDKTRGSADERRDYDKFARRVFADYARSIEKVAPFRAKAIQDMLKKLGVCTRCGGLLDAEGYCYCQMDDPSTDPFDPSKEPA